MTAPKRRGALREFVWQALGSGLLKEHEAGRYLRYALV
jgi:hypothetical protein